MSARTTAHGACHADALTHRHITTWRRATARLAVLVNTAEPPPALTAEVFALQRQCERLAADFQHLGELARCSRNHTTNETRRA